MTSDGDPRVVTLRPELYSFEVWKKKKELSVAKERQLLKEKQAKEAKEKAEQKEKAMRDYLAWKSARNAEEAKQRRVKKAEACRLMQGKAKEEEEKKLVCKKAFEKWLNDKKEEEKRKFHKKAKGVCRLPKTEEIKGLESDEKPNELQEAAFRKQDAQKAFKFWLRKKNEERNARMKAAMRKHKNMERKARGRDELALESYEKWLESLDRREEREEEFVEKMRELELSKPPWIPA